MSAPSSAVLNKWARPIGPELAGHLRVDGDALLTADPDYVRDQLRLRATHSPRWPLRPTRGPSGRGAEKQATPSRVTVQVSNRLRMFHKPIVNWRIRTASSRLSADFSVDDPFRRCEPDSPGDGHRRVVLGVHLNSNGFDAMLLQRVGGGGAPAVTDCAEQVRGGAGRGGAGPVGRTRYAQTAPMLSASPISAPPCSVPPAVQRCGARDRCPRACWPLADSNSTPSATA